ncbi:MAG: hypothetical protein M3442_11005 [Chloroflexota bacterium]|nr:hypothetical protein [Chloroflexota bacterium]
MPRHPRAAGTTRRKCVWFTPKTVARVERWAAEQGMTFSAAAEALLRLGLQDAPVGAFTAPLEATIRGTVRDELGRVTALLASAAIDAHAGYLVALHLAKRGQDVEHYQGLKQAARLTARETVSRRVSRQGLEQLVGLFGASDDDPDGATAAG